MFKFFLKFNFNWNLSTLRDNNKRTNNNFLNLLLFIKNFKLKFKKFEFFFKVFWIKKNIKKMVFLKAAFKHKIPKHVIVKFGNSFFIKIEKKQNIFIENPSLLWFYKKLIIDFSKYFLPDGVQLVKFTASASFNLNFYFFKNDFFFLNFSKKSKYDSVFLKFILNFLKSCLIDFFVFKHILCM